MLRHQTIPHILYHPLSNPPDHTQFFQIFESKILVVVDSGFSPPSNMLRERFCSFLANTLHNATPQLAKGPHVISLES